MSRRSLKVSGAAVALVLAVTTLTSCTIGSTPDPSTSGQGSVPGLPDAALTVMNQPQFSSGRWLISVVDIESGETLIDLDSDKMTEPGSFVKTYSAGAAWLRWGPDHRITTPVKRTGEVVGTSLEGDLVLVGQGDLTMGGRTKADGTVDFADLDHNDANPLPGATLTTEDPLAGLDELAAQVKASGIDRINGQVIVDDRLFEGSLGGEPLSPIIVNQNLIDVLITPGEVGEPATVVMSPVVSPWKITNQVETVAAGGDLAISDPASPRQGEIVVGGTITADSPPQLKVYALEDPATFARTAFIEALGRAGVAVSGELLEKNSTETIGDQAVVDSLPTVAELKSLPLGEEITYVMKVSYNRGAQTLVCRLAVDAGAKDCDAGMAVMGELWAKAGLSAAGASLVDGSGLEGNLITPDNAVEAQRILAKRADAERWKATLPILGVDGSLAEVHAESPAAGKVFAKTGTLAGSDLFNGRLRLATKSLGGIMETAGGRRLAFMIAVNQGFYAEVGGVFEANDDVGEVAAIIQQHY